MREKPLSKNVSNTITSFSQTSADSLTVLVRFWKVPPGSQRACPQRAWSQISQKSWRTPHGSPSRISECNVSVVMTFIRHTIRTGNDVFLKRKYLDVIELNADDDSRMFFYFLYLLCFVLNEPAGLDPSIVT